MISQIKKLFVLATLMLSAYAVNAGIVREEIEVTIDGSCAFTFEIGDASTQPDVYFQFLIENSDGVFENWDFYTQFGFGLQKISGSGDASLVDWFVGSPYGEEYWPDTGGDYYLSGPLRGYFQFSGFPAGTYTIEVWGYETISDLHAF